MINLIKLFESYSIILPFVIRLFDVVKHRQTYSCAQALRSTDCTTSLLSAPTCFPSTCAAGLLCSTKHNFAFGNHPTTLLQSHAVRLLTSDSCTAPGVSRHAECNGVTVDQRYITALLLSNRLYSTYRWRRIRAQEVVLHTYKLHILPQYLVHSMCSVSVQCQYMPVCL